MEEIVKATEEEILRAFGLKSSDLEAYDTQSVVSAEMQYEIFIKKMRSGKYVKRNII